MSGFVDRVAGLVTEHGRAVIVVLLVASLALGAGAPMVGSSSSLDQFQSETPEGEALEYASANFTTGAENTTTVQVIVRGDNVIDRESLLAQLRFQRSLRSDDAVAPTLVEERPTVGIANLVATTAIRQEAAAALRERAAALNATATRVNATAAELTATLGEARVLQAEYDALNDSREAGNIPQSAYEQQAAAIEANLTAAREAGVEAAVALDAVNASAGSEFAGLFGQVRTLQAEYDRLNDSREAGNISQSVYEQQAAEQEATIERTVRGGVRSVLAPAYRALEERGAALEADRRALQNASTSGATPPLDEQVAQLEEMNASAVADTVGRLLTADGSNGAAFGFMPTSYEAGSTTATATTIIVTQVSEATATGGGTASDRIVDSQLELKSIAESAFGEGEALVFGAGIITDEINRSMMDSVAIVGPLALLFVVVVLVIAYRDLLDILLGVVGIGLVLVWTFGFMGYADIAFNQIFVAVPVLLIGLSIDYAIHVFMRHREERARGDGDGVGRSMRVALASVGVALTLVTATTVIGFLSNLTSSVPPIRQFGIVSAVGIVAALLIFGLLVPALKTEVDGFLEARGWDRSKRAFGTGGGRLGRLLTAGSAAARRAPWVVVLVTLVVTGLGVVGASQVSTSFSQTDFIADDPPDWTDELPEPLRPGDYDAKESLTFVNKNFVVENSQAQLLVRGDVADPALLDRLASVADRAADSDVVVTLSNGEADIQSPNTALRAVAARNETVAGLLAAADTDGDGRPEEDVAALYDAALAADTGQLRNVVYRGDGGDYEAVRLVVATVGGADGGQVTEEMRALGTDLDGSGVSVVATGQPIVFNLVSDQLLETVVESLLITLVAIFLFLMVTYRLTDGSATLGVVTLLPVAFSVSWILGTMFVLDIPFNVLTGLITSLTVGLGVAYSIHLSERYVYELELAGDRWEAMRTALSGTGGALLGSAATTVGGFGVLAFAILPPLRQFGIITGLTIIYAFLGSVLVLPTFLALWTRYLGPDPGTGGTAPDEGGPDDGSTTGAEPAADAGGATDGAPAANGGPTDDGEGSATAGSGAGAGVADGTGGEPDRTPSPTRSVDRSYVEPGRSYAAEVTLEAPAGRLLVREIPPGVELTIVETSPEPVDVVVDDGTAYVAWDLPEATTARVRYRATVPADAADGAELGFTGLVRVPGAEGSVAGADHLTVVADVFERILAQGDVTGSDLRAAAEALRDDRLSHEQFERVYDEWLRRREPRPADTTDTTDTTGGTGSTEGTEGTEPGTDPTDTGADAG